MTQAHHVRTVEIRTCTASCDRCPTRSRACTVESLLVHGWRLGDGKGVPDLCPECASDEEKRELRRELDEARARSIAALEAGEPPLVHGRVYGGAGA